MNLRLQHGHHHLDSPPEITNIREVTRADLAHLTVKREPNVVQTLRDNHHRIARAVASGMSNIDVAATCGIAINRVSMLKADPAFAELTAHYRAIITSEWAQQDTVIEFLRTNQLKSQALIAGKLEAIEDRAQRAIESARLTGEPVSPEVFGPTRDLLGIAELGLDRTGYGKVNKNINVNVDFAAKLEAARNRSARASDIRQIETVGAHTLTPSQSAGADIHLPDAPLPQPSFRRV